MNPSDFSEEHKWNHGVCRKKAASPSCIYCITALIQKLNETIKLCCCWLFVGLGRSVGFISTCLLRSLIRVGASLFSLHATEQTGLGLEKGWNQQQAFKVFFFIVHVIIFSNILELDGEVGGKKQKNGEGKSSWEVVCWVSGWRLWILTLGFPSPFLVYSRAAMLQSRINEAVSFKNNNSSTSLMKLSVMTACIIPCVYRHGKRKKKQKRKHFCFCRTAGLSWPYFLFNCCSLSLSTLPSI